VQLNLLANLAGQSAGAILGLLCVPSLVRLLGMEGYGVAAVHTAICAAFGVLDLGLSTAVNRQLARLSGQPDTQAQMHATVRAVGRAYWLLVLIVGAALFLLAPVLAEGWFRPDRLDPADLTRALRLMALTVVLQWPAVFYAGCLAGLQHQTRLNLINITGAAIRFPGAVALLAWGEPTLPVYFTAQAAAGVLQTSLTAWSVWRVLPAPKAEPPSAPQPVEPVWRFAAGISGVAVTALVLTQFDKLVLSALLPLDRFGGYMLAASVAGGLAIISGAVYAAALPRLSELVAAGVEANVRAFYHHAAQVLGVLLFPVGAVLIVFAEELMRVWTGNPLLAAEVAPQVRLLVGGFVLTGAYLIPIALQYAHGWTRLTLVLNTVAILVQVPLLPVLARYAGGTGAAAIWLLIGLFTMAVGPFVMHRRLLRGEWLRWGASDLLLPAVPPVLICVALAFVPLPTDRILLGLVLTGIGLMALLGAVVCVPVTRRWGVAVFRRLR
jgi:O-antigen/teichoic acid export membrane protein